MSGAAHQTLLSINSQIQSPVLPAQMWHATKNAQLTLHDERLKTCALMASRQSAGSRCRGLA